MATDSDEHVEDDLRRAVTGRFRDPFVFGLVLGLVTANWRFLYILARHEGPTATTIDAAAKELRFRSLASALLVAAMWAVVVPWLSAWALYLREWLARYARNRRLALNEGLAMTRADWLKHPDYISAQMSLRIAEARDEDLRRALTEVWARALKEIGEAQRANLTAVLETEAGAPPSTHIVLRQATKALRLPVELNSAQLPNLVYVVASLTAGLVLTVPIGGVVPWDYQTDSRMVLFARTGSEIGFHDDAKAIPPEALLVIRQMREHPKWGVLQQPGDPPDPTTIEQSPPDAA